jgi:UDP-N-acetylglucosamine acyltransferase
VTIHPSAIVDKSAEIAPDATVGPYAIIGPGVKIGAGCKIHAHAVIEYTTLGANCEVYPQAAIGLPGQHLRYKGEPAGVVVGTGTIFREGVTIHRGTPFDASLTTIGNNCFFMALSHVAHDCRIGNNFTIANGSVLAGHVVVGDNVFISGLAAVHQYARLGRGSFVSGGAMANLDVPPFCFAQGDRAVLRGINVVGMRRLGIDRQQIRDVKEAYKTVFLSGQLLNDALASPELNTGGEAVTAFRDFLKTAKRGFARPEKGSSTLEAELTA